MEKCTFCAARLVNVSLGERLPLKLELHTIETSLESALSFACGSVVRETKWELTPLGRHYQYQLANPNYELIEPCSRTRNESVLFGMLRSRKVDILETRNRELEDRVRELEKKVFKNFKK